MARYCLRWLAGFGFASIALLVVSNGIAQIARPADDAAWIRTFAAPYRLHTSAGDQIGRENSLLWDPRFRPLLNESFPQKQTFWYDHHRLIPVPDLVQTFIGVPGDAILDQHQYVTVDGCVPHDCVANRGMLWIDTETTPPLVIFAAIDVVRSDAGKNMSHVWIFSSAKLDWKLPTLFISGMQRWLSTIEAKGYMGTSGYHYNFALATIVQPDGVTVDVDPANLQLNNLERAVNQ